MPAEQRNELEQTTANLILKKRGAQPEVILDRLDTTGRSYVGNGRSSIGGYPESSRSFSSRIRSGRTPTALELPSLAPQQRQPHKPLPDPPQQRRSPRQYIEDLIYSPRFGLRSPLSARSAAFLVNLQQTFQSAVDLCRYRRFENLLRSPQLKKDAEHGRFGEDLMEAQRSDDLMGQPINVSRLEPWRKVVIAACILAVLIILGLLIGLVLIGSMKSKHASHWLMAASGGIVVLTAMAMLAARRNLGEVLVTAMLGVLICQCVMDDFHAGTQ